MAIMSRTTLPDLPDLPVPRAAFLLYTCQGRLLATVHPLRASQFRPGRHRRGSAPHPPRPARLVRDTRRSDPGGRYRVAPTPCWRAAGIFRLVAARPHRPDLVFTARRTLRVFACPGRLHVRGCGHDAWCTALARNARPQPNTMLCHAPLMNVNAHGAVCLGNAEPPSEGATAPAQHRKRPSVTRIFAMSITTARSRWPGTSGSAPKPILLFGNG